MGIIFGVKINPADDHSECKCLLLIGGNTVRQSRTDLWRLWSGGEDNNGELYLICGFWISSIVSMVTVEPVTRATLSLYDSE